MALHILESKKALEEFLTSSKKIILLVATTTCPPCKRFSPIVEKVSNEMKDISFGKIFLDNDISANTILSVGSVPTLIFYLDGKEIFRELGYMDEQVLVARIDSRFS